MIAQRQSKLQLSKGVYWQEKKKVSCGFMGNVNVCQRIKCRELKCKDKGQTLPPQGDKEISW